MLSIKNLYASVEGQEILKGINLEIKPGEVHAIMGPNGSGKSTLIKLFSGVYKPTSGTIMPRLQDPSALTAMLAFSAMHEEIRRAFSISAVTVLRQTVVTVARVLSGHCHRGRISGPIVAR